MSVIEFLLYSFLFFVLCYISLHPKSEKILHKILLKLNLNVWLARKLIQVVKDNNIEKVKELIESGVDINFQDEDKKTALMYAVFFRYKYIVGLLIEKGADLDIQDDYGNTAYDLAKKEGDEDIAKIIENHKLNNNK